MDTFDVEYRRKIGCTIHAGIFTTKAKNADAARQKFQKEISTDTIGEYEILRIVPVKDI